MPATADPTGRFQVPDAAARNRFANQHFDLLLLRMMTSSFKWTDEDDQQKIPSTIARLMIIDH